VSKYTDSFDIFAEMSSTPHSTTPAAFALHSSRVLTDKGLKDMTVFVKHGVIIDLQEGKVNLPEFPLEDLGKLVIMPGLIDSHVHINEPGRTEWEGFETITRAAVAGGITTLVDMPLNASPVTTTAAAFRDKIKSARGKMYCNVGFWGGLVPDNTGNLEELIAAGVLGFKAFLTHSGIDEFPNVTKEDLRKAMPIIARHDLPLLAHAELEEMHEGVAAFENDPTSYQAYLHSRPKSWEDKAVKMMIGLASEYDCRVHIVHLSSADSLEQIKEARNKGIPLTVETCPQYLYFCAEDILDGKTIFKCAPPIRERANNENLWKGLKEGLIDFVVTDHSPCSPELKMMESGNLKEAWGGIASLQFSLPAMWTKARKKGFSLRDISALMSTHIAAFIGFGNRKGQIKKGFDADLVVWDPEQKFKVEKEMIHFRHKISPYIGESLDGLVRQTYVAGRKVYQDGEVFSPPQGKVLLRPEHGILQ
jgi:allantoinase